MSKRNQHNIGETNKTSVKVHHGPGGQSNWSLGWGQDVKEETKKTQTIPIVKYHNESNIVLGEKTKEELQEEEKKILQEENKKKEQLNNKLPGYDPKAGGKSTVHFGDEKTDYRKKDEVFTSVKVKNPPGGKSNIQFG